MRRGKRERARGCQVEFLECRALMATFQMPGLEGLAEGRHMAATFNRMVGSLQAQIAFQAPRDTAPETLSQVVDEVIDQYEAASRAAFARASGTLALLIDQGEALRSSIDALVGRYDLGELPRSWFNADAYMEISGLTQSRDVWPSGTPLQTFLVLATRTSDDLTSIGTFVQTTSTVTDEEAAAVLTVQARAFQDEAGLGANRLPGVARVVDRAASTYIADVNAAVGSPHFDALVATAAADFASALIGPGGAFGPGGTFGRRIPQPPRVETPLSIDDAATFAHLRYVQVTTTSPMLLHRNFSSASNRYGRFMSKDVFDSPAQAVRRLALDQSWYGTNQATFVQTVTLPAGTLVYVGHVAPIYQGIFSREASPRLYPGMASQYLVADTRAPGIIWGDFRATGT